MSLQNPSATRLRWSAPLMELLGNPNGDEVKQRAAARLLRTLAHPSMQDELEHATLLHTERRALGSLAEVYIRRKLVPPVRVVVHLLEHAPRTLRSTYLTACEAYPALVREHVAGLEPALARTLLFNPRCHALTSDAHAWLKDRASTATESPAAAAARQELAQISARVKRRRDAGEYQWFDDFHDMQNQIRLDLEDYDALDFSMVEEVFMYSAGKSFQASESFTAWALHKPELFEGAFLARACAGHALSEHELERARASATLVIHIAALGVEAHRSDEAAGELRRLCSDAAHVVERAEAMRALRKARPQEAAQVALTQLHDTSTYSDYLAPMRVECTAAITPEHCDERAFDALVEARLAATELQFDDDSNDGAWKLERAIEHWLGSPVEERSPIERTRPVRVWTAMYVSWVLSPDTYDD